MISNWRKSSHSEAHGNCVELAALPNAVAFRDSKAPHTGHLALTQEAFTALLSQAKLDRLNPR
ncbi:DUF397 domain-containing protein [Actinomadura decatromicini]|uniref:DUF397 domain-containing protein n=1 Tax=Actinomadura decatromicini TaxID=2604572 RepID=A0A5D3FRI3_9ACTN|nr:DUF397 domain-containing protein [Actinomadura decatromicini]TYK50951.1 DUF397 domain-containing protein [Actinomadura decatromicini]